MQFEDELARVLPLDIPNRERLIEKSAEHLRRISSANERMNLTRIISPSEAAIKHVYDSVAPWRHFQDAQRVLDAGTGAGFPGIPLAIVLPAIRFTLAESIQKKARFVDSVVESLELANVQVTPHRAEEVIETQGAEVITARAVAPLERILDLFKRALEDRARLLLYKGSDVDLELTTAQRHRMLAEVLCRYDLPDHLGGRSLVEIKANHAGRGALRKRGVSNPR
ncbi:MAG: 16S rRNA (guanine(527)-N(7))-methyltransferase RsmG [Acidobacteriaceae bacterium]|nr:16S rRNA (guanine(527)-N(7))-methyltransferase RsmG [Acidobacteriaceae bacterium]